MSNLVVLAAVARDGRRGFRPLPASWHARHAFDVALCIAEGWLHFREPDKLKITKSGLDELRWLKRGENEVE